MKNLITYLKALWSWVADSQSTDVSLDCRLTVGSPSGFNSKLMLKLVSVLVLMLTVGSGNVWALGDSYTVGAKVTTLVNNDLVVWGYDDSHLATGTISSNWLTISGTKADWQIYKVVKSGDYFYLQKDGTTNYVYSSAVKKMAWNTSNKTKISLNTSGEGYNVLAPELGGYYYNYNNGSGGIRPYAMIGSNSKTYLYKVVASASVSAPTFGVAAGTYNNNQSVTLSCATDGATIYYTSSTNGVAPADPTSSSTAYSSAITVDHDNTIIKAIAIKGGTNSTVASATYRLTCATPTFSPAEGAYVGTQSVTISSATTSANIYYTTNGSTPTTSSTLYSGAITVSSSQTIKALVTKSNYTNSAVGSAAYTITPAYTVTWKNQGTNVTTTNVASGSKPVFPDMSAQSGCSTYTYFYGWAEGTWSGEVASPGTSSTVKVYKSASEMPDVTGNVTYHAVWGDSPGGWTKASSIAAGDVVVLVNEDNKAELTACGTSTTGYGTGEKNTWTTTPNGTYPLTVEAGAADGTFSFKNGTNYLCYNSDATSSANYMWTITDKTNYSSWTVTYSSGDFILRNKGNTGRYIRYNSSSPRFSCYYSASESPSQNPIQIYKQSADANCVTSCCNQLGTIGGAVSSYTQTSVTLEWTKLSNVAAGTPYTVTASGGSVGAIDLSGAKATCTVTGLSCGTAYTFSITAHGTTGYCDKTQSGIAQTTSSYSVSYTVTNGTKTSGDATTCGPLTAVFSANSGYHLPDKAAITVTGASDFSWTKATGTLNITAIQITGNISISFTCPADACTDAFSLHTGTKNGGDYVYNKCFSDADWGAADDAIWTGEFPSTNECYVGYAGGDSYHGAYWAVGGIKTYDIPNGRTLGWNSSDYYNNYPATAIGTFHIYKNSTDANYYLRFKPTTYVLRTGSDGTSWTSRDMTVSGVNANYYESEFVTLTSTMISENAYVDLKANNANGHVWCNFSNSRTASGNVKVKNGASTFRATDLQAADNGSYGKFQIDITQDVDNWKLAFVPYYRITYNANGGSGSTPASSYVEVGSSAAAAANGFTAPTGKQFGGWATSAVGSKAYDPTDAVTLNSNVELFAVWTDIDYTVTVNQSPSVGATTTGQTSSAHYNGTINLTTTVPSGYRFVNWTTSDGFSITNPTSATTASFTMPNKNVTVTANFQQTHTVDWYVGGSAPANKIGDDGQTTVVDHGGKIEDFPATTPDGTPCDKTFVGWTNTTSYTHGTSLLFTDVAGSPTIDADASFYAVFATGGDYSWTRVTSVATITGGGTFIIGYEGDYENNPGVLVPMQNANATATTSANGLIRCGDASNEFNNNTITMGSLGNHGGDDYEVIISEGTTSGTIAIQMADGNYIGKPTKGNNAKLFAAKGACTNITPVIGDDDVVRLKFNNDSSLQFNNNSSQYRFARYKNTQQDVVLYKKTGGLSGFTITCADCGTSVTPTYTASPTGGTVSVTKSASPVTSGSTVKTCTAVDLTVTLTPATHYDLTGFTATGLTTGTATITPAVGSTLPVSVAQTFTVTVSAGATGTLTLAPTFTAQTPLSITLETHSKGTFTPIGDIYSGESFTFPTVTPSDAECSSFLGWIEGTTWSGDGTETDPTAITGLANYHAAGSSSGTLTTTKTYTAVFGEKDTQVIPAYQKVTSAPSNWSGDYLIVRDANSRAFDGSLSTLDAADNYIGVTISEGSITANSTVNASKWTIAKVGATSNYTIKSASGYYIGRTANSNGLNSSTSEAYTNTLSYSVDHVVITSSGGPTLQMNSGTRFRYYTSSQQALQLYKYNPDAEVVSYTYTTNPACTPRYRVTISSATGGSPEADKTYEHADETITITANPAAGYSFTSWTITKTTGGDNVTSTLLTGDKPTTANTTFTMPAYDITIAATYTKKMVSTLEVKDGATVVSTTTGPVSGTVNISTGANKTLDVVITPSDAYDHSWTATVSAGSTYASITNVTDDSFRVNGLAQGDATITVNAPNDGSAKSVTLTVQVRDIMPEEIILKRDGSNTPIETLIMYYDETNSKGQYVKVNVGYSPANPTNKAFTFSSALTGKVGSHSHAPASGYEVLVANGVTSDAVNCTFTSSADGSVTKVLAVTVLPILSDRFVDYVHGNATQTVSARLSDDRYSIIPDINTPSLSDASDANPTSEDCETSHYHLVGWLPQTTAEALWAAGTPITDATEGLVRAGESVEATGQTWCAIWAEEQ